MNVVVCNNDSCKYQYRDDKEIGCCGRTAITVTSYGSCDSSEQRSDADAIDDNA